SECRERLASIRLGDKPSAKYAVVVLRRGRQTKRIGYLRWHRVIGLVVADGGAVPQRIKASRYEPTSRQTRDLLKVVLSSIGCGEVASSEGRVAGAKRIAGDACGLISKLLGILADPHR